MDFQYGVERTHNDGHLGITNTVVCETTLRVVLVSLFPEHLSDLIPYLSKHCCDVFIAHSVDLNIMRAMQPDVVVLDHTVAIPISCKPNADEVEELTAVYLLPSEVDPNQLELGPNIEVVMYPANFSELLYRLRALHRQQRLPFQSVNNRRTFKNMTMNYERKQAVLNHGGLDLTKSEFDILWTLVESNGAVLSREEIMDKVWGEQYVPGSNTIDVHIKALRKKLKDNANSPQYIETVRGVGYRLSV